jgi:DNA-3-methyladenine glycosylase II
MLERTGTVEYRLNPGTKTFTVTPRGPFAWDAATDMLAHFPPMQRHWQGTAEPVRLAFLLDLVFTPVAVALHWDGEALQGEVAGTDDLEATAKQVARIFSLDHDGADYPEVGRRNPEIGALMSALPGLRPVCFTSPYECAAWAIISHRINAKQAAGIQMRLAAEHGHPVQVAGEEVLCFPRPERLLDLTAVPSLMLEKVERLKGVAHAALGGLLDAEQLRTMGDEAALAALCTIPGIGPFWSSLIYLRGCGIHDVFPDEPLAIAALGHLYGLGDRPDLGMIRAITERFSPYRMWVCFLLRVAVNRGLVPGVAGREGTITRAGGRLKHR